MALIDADKLKEKLSEITITGDRDTIGYIADVIKGVGVSIIQAIDSMPTVEAEPVRHGYWIPVDGGDSCDEWDCSVCDSRMTFMCEKDYDDMREEFPRCPKCGAYMDVEEGG